MLSYRPRLLSLAIITSVEENKQKISEEALCSMGAENVTLSATGRVSAVMSKMCFHSFITDIREDVPLVFASCLK